MRRALATLLALLTVAVVAPAAADARATSTNWAGWAASRTGVSFRHVSAAWTVAAVDCSQQADTSSATWVGLGGYHTSAKALEQTGTEADCSRSGTAEYGAWYELVPQTARELANTVKAGDRMTASVTVTGHRVRVRLADDTRGWVVDRTITASAVDTSSAEWIVEAPSLCSADATTCSATSLADFGTQGFTRARATTSTGRSGTIGSALWSARPIDLVPGGSSGRSFPGAQAVDATSSDGATAGALSASGGAFGVTFAAGTTTTTPSQTGPPTFGGGPGGGGPGFGRLR